MMVERNRGVKGLVLKNFVLCYTIFKLVEKIRLYFSLGICERDFSCIFGKTKQLKMYMEEIVKRLLFLITPSQDDLFGIQIQLLQLSFLALK